MHYFASSNKGKLLLLLLVICQTCLAGVEIPVRAGTVKAGLGRVLITPALPMWLSGYANRDLPAAGVVHDLWAKALAIEDAQGMRVVIVTTDILGLSHEIAEEVAKEVKIKYGLDRKQLLLNSSHTHSGPMIWPCVEMIYEFNTEEQDIVSRYGQELARNIVKAIDTAIAGMKPALLFTGHGEADFAINRRNALFPKGPIDHDVPVLKLLSPDGGLRAILFGYACHNTTNVETNYLFNGDYAGFAQIELERLHPGVQAMFLMGCGGDQNPYPRGTMDFARQHGKELADAVQKVLMGKMTTVTGPLRAAYTVIDLPFRPFDPAIYRKDIVGTNRFFQRRAKLMLEAYNKGWNVSRLPYPVQVLRFGADLSIVALSEEVVVDYALRTKEEFKNQNMVIAGYSNEVMCYLPSQRVLKEGGYEGDENMVYYGQPGPFADGVEDSVFHAIHDLMTQTDIADKIKK